MTAASGDGPMLSIAGLTIEFSVRGAWYPAINNLSLDIQPNETLALVGESGSGKSVTALSVMRLLPLAAARVPAGRIMFDGQDLLTLPEGGMEALRGNRIAMIFQEPMTSLNPVMTIGDQVAEVLLIHRGLRRREARAEALALLERVKIPAARERFSDFPHQFSGGMRQRVMIAIALACQPRVLLADEPTTALDVTIQAQVLSLLAELQQDQGMAMLFITHNLGVVAAIADRVAVMYAGEIVEIAPVNALFENPRHPYTDALLRAMPRVDRTNDQLAMIPGQVPAIYRMPGGCRFSPRCPFKQEQCATPPQLRPVPGSGGAHMARCPVRVPLSEA